MNSAKTDGWWAVQLALSAASPAFRGYLADVDARWNVIAGSVDDRTEEERGLKVRPALSTPSKRAYQLIFMSTSASQAQPSPYSQVSV
jgi:hypothetical protein